MTHEEEDLITTEHIFEILKRRYEIVVLMGLTPRSKTQETITKYFQGSSFALIGVLEHHLDLLRHELMRAHFDQDEDDDDEPDDSH